MEGCSESRNRQGGKKKEEPSLNLRYSGRSGKEETSCLADVSGFTAEKGGLYKRGKRTSSFDCPEGGRGDERRIGQEKNGCSHEDRGG